MQRAKAKHVDIVAHSYGGVVTVSLVSSPFIFACHIIKVVPASTQINSYFLDFKKKVQKIAFTDSVHSYNPARVSQAKWSWLAEVRLL